jgi:hypothetical protein
MNNHIKLFLLLGFSVINCAERSDFQVQDDMVDPSLSYVDRLARQERLFNALKDQYVELYAFKNLGHYGDIASVEKQLSAEIDLMGSRKNQIAFLNREIDKFDEDTVNKFMQKKGEEARDFWSADGSKE